MIFINVNNIFTLLAKYMTGIENKRGEISFFNLLHLLRYIENNYKWRK